MFHAPGRALRGPARRRSGPRRDARGDRARAAARAAGDRPAGRGPAGRGDAVDQRRRLHTGQPRAARGGRPRLRLPELGPMNLMVTRTKPSAMMLRWLTIGAAAGAALTMRSEEHTSELRSLRRTPYAVLHMTKQLNTTYPIY